MVRKDLPPGQPLIQTIPVSEAYYWVDEDGTLKIALKYQRESLLSDLLEVTSRTSLVLDGLPAGREKLYKLRRNDLMWTLSGGGSHQRLRSLKGVAVIEGSKRDRIEGRLHATIHQQKFTVLSGWKSSGLLTVVGDFAAVRNKAKGTEIFDAVESEDFNRETSVRRGLRTYRRPLQPLQSQPASQPKD
jgi:hypothetical protein